MDKTSSTRVKLADSDLFVAVVCAFTIAALYCLRLGLVQGSVSHALFLSMFVVPVALGITIFIELPVVFLMRMGNRTSPLEYTFFPGFTVLLLWIGFTLSGAGTVSVLNAKGRAIIQGGHVVWRNIGWMIMDLEYVEPALWASVAGLAFWLIRVKAP